MARHKEQETKEFLIAARKKVGPGVSNAPFWVVRKKGERIWNRRQKRHWRSTDIKKLLTKLKNRKENYTPKGKAHYRKGKKNRVRTREKR